MNIHNRPSTRSPDSFPCKQRTSQRHTTVKQVSLPSICFAIEQSRKPSLCKPQVRRSSLENASSSRHHMNTSFRADCNPIWTQVPLPPRASTRKATFRILGHVYRFYVNSTVFPPPARPSRASLACARSARLLLRLLA
jgi:hypothetical protein